MFLGPRPCFLPPCSYNKQVLKVFPYPITLTAMQFAVGGLLACTMWITGLHKRPQVNFVETVSAHLCVSGV